MGKDTFVKYMRKITIKKWKSKNIRKKERINHRSFFVRKKPLITPLVARTVERFSLIE